MSGKSRTKKHYEVLDAIKAYKGAHGFSPTLRDIQNLTGITSTSVVNYYLNKLEDEGLIRREPNIGRSIQLGNFPPKPRVSAARKRRDIIRKATEKEMRKRRAVAMSFQERINYAVGVIRQKEKQDVAVYALHNNRPLFNEGRLRGSKIG